MTAQELLSNKNFENINYQMNTSSNIIKIIGVGGGGGNAVNNMYNDGVEDVTFVLCNTDDQALQQSPISNQILLGKNTTGGWGAGNDPKKAREAAESSLPEIEDMLKNNTRMAFITAGMGGGTGTGAAPVIAEACHRLDILTVGIVTIPFAFEPKKKMQQAIAGIVEMSPFLDALLVIRNDKIPVVYPDATLATFTKYADKILASAAMGIVEIITKHGYINVDFADVFTTLKKGGRTVMDSGFGSGEHRVGNAIKDALSSPLLYDFDIKKSKKVLLVIYTSTTNEITAAELNEITEFMSTLDDEIDFIWGAFYDDTLGDRIKITLIATGAAVSGVMPEELGEMEKIIQHENDKTKEEIPQAEPFNPNNEQYSLADLDDEGKLVYIQNTPAYQRVC
ncbi:MAG: cell division protein FtsZ [Prevotellaceae bacterium]|jgi:cell division protein FtsZ|nr:cell division protein FtsZ [Prevotellaceae bacterium]